MFNKDYSPSIDKGKTLYTNDPNKLDDANNSNDYYRNYDYVQKQGFDTATFDKSGFANAEDYEDKVYYIPKNDKIFIDVNGRGYDSSRGYTSPAAGSVLERDGFDAIVFKKPNTIRVKGIQSENIASEVYDRPRFNEYSKKYNYNNPFYMKNSDFGNGAASGATKFWFNSQGKLVSETANSSMYNQAKATNSDNIWNKKKYNELQQEEAGYNSYLDKTRKYDTGNNLLMFKQQ